MLARHRRRRSVRIEYLEEGYMEALRFVLVSALAVALFAPSALSGPPKSRPASFASSRSLEGRDQDAQIKGAMDGLEAAAKMYPGITRVWLKPIKMQGEIGDKKIGGVIVMEFASEDAPEEVRR